MIYNILNELSNESGTNKKMEILKSHKDNELLKRVLYKGMSNRIKFWIKKIPQPLLQEKEKESLEWALEKLIHLENRTVTGNDALAFVATLLGRLSDEDSDVITRIIKKDLKIGMGRTNINKVIPNLIEKTPYMGARAFSQKVVDEIVSMGPMYSQVKMDGRYCNVIIRNGEIEAESRGGETSYLDGAKFLNELSNFPNYVLNGELTLDKVDRYTSNGIISSLISIGKKRSEGKNVKKEIESFEQKNGISMQQALDSIRYTVWDIITVDEYYDNVSKVKYNKRLELLNNLLDEYKPTMVTLIESIEVNTKDEAIQHFKQKLLEGQEGTILKSQKGIWKDGKPKWQCKMKLEIDLDLKIVGFNYGTVGSKNENLISSLTVQTSDGLLETRPAGINEEQMHYITNNKEKLIGSIVTVKCSGLSNDREGNNSLLHPVFIDFRDDKTEADSFDDAKKIQNMSLGLSN